MQSQTPSSDPESMRTLWMGAVQHHWTEDFLRAVFLQETGEIVSVKLFKNNFSLNRNDPIGYAFIVFQTEEAAATAKDKLQNQTIPHTSVRFRLNWAVRDRKKTSQQEEQTQHTLFVGDLAEEVTDEMLLHAFQERFQSCVAANVVVDPTTGQSKKYGFVRFASPEDKEIAKETMGGAQVGSREIRVGEATAKGDPPMAPVMKKPLKTTLFVGNLDSNIDEPALKAHFARCPGLLGVRIPQFKKGCGFVYFDSVETAQRALGMLDKSRLGNAKIRLDWGRDKLAISLSNGINSTYGMNMGMLNNMNLNVLGNMKPMPMGMNMNNMNNLNMAMSNMNLVNVMPMQRQAPGQQPTSPSSGMQYYQAQQGGSNLDMNNMNLNMMARHQQQSNNARSGFEYVNVASLSQYNTAANAMQTFTAMPTSDSTFYNYNLFGYVPSPTQGGKPPMNMYNPSSAHTQSQMSHPQSPRLEKPEDILMRSDVNVNGFGAFSYEQ